MRKKLYLAVLIAVLAALFASRNPDGLDKVSQMLGFAGKGTENAAIMTGYSIGFLGESGLSTAAAGIAGVLITFGIFALCAMIIRKYISFRNNALRVHK